MSLAPKALGSSNHKNDKPIIGFQKFINSLERIDVSQDDEEKAPASERSWGFGNNASTSPAT
jgi:hypothetical protein